MLATYVNIHEAISKLALGELSVDNVITYLVCGIGEPQRYTKFIQSCFRAYVDSKYDAIREEFKRAFIRETGSDLTLPTIGTNYDWLTVGRSIVSDYDVSNRYTPNALAQHLDILTHVMYTDATQAVQLLRHIALNDNGQFKMVFRKVFEYVMEIPIDTIRELIQFAFEELTQPKLASDELVRNMTYQLKIFHPAEADDTLEWLCEHVPEFNTPRAKRDGLDEYLRNLS